MGAPKISATFFLKHQWMPLDGWKNDYREMGDCSKGILLPNNWAQELH